MKDLSFHCIRGIKLLFEERDVSLLKLNCRDEIVGNYDLEIRSETTTFGMLKYRTDDELLSTTKESG